MFRFRSICGALAASVLVQAVPALAVPSPYVSKFGPLKINNQTNATLMRDTDNASLVWVLPPTAGEASFKNFVPSANLQFCRGLSDTVKTMSSIDAQIGALSGRFKEMEKEYKAAAKRVADAREALGKLAQTEGTGKYVTLSLEIDGMNENLMTVLKNLETCEDSCDVLRAEYKRLAEDIRSSKKRLRDLEDQYNADVKAYKAAQNRVTQAEAIKADTIGQVNALADELAKLGATVFNVYGTRGKLEGGFAQIHYSTGWDDAVKKLEAQYPQYDFEKISTYNVKLFANFVGAADQHSYMESLPSILDYTISGLRYLPWTETKSELMALPSVLSGNVRMSVIGSCPLVMKDFFKDSGYEIKRNATGEPQYAISATYEYPVSYHYQVTASYNLYKFYEQIKKSGKSGGFFSSRSYSEVIENKQDTDMFSIDWKVEDPQSSMTQEKRDQITKDLKSQLMDRVLRQIAQPGVALAESANFYDAGSPPDSGAVVFAKGLRQTCGFNIYCQGASWVLTGLQAIFGSSSSEQTYRQTWNRTATEKWSADVATLRAGAITIAP